MLKRLIFIGVVVVGLGCEDEPPSQRPNDPAPTPTPVERPAEAEAPPIGGPPTTTPVPTSAPPTEVDPPVEAPPAPRPKTIAPPTGRALGAPATTRLIQVVRPTAQLPEPVSLEIVRPAPGEVLATTTLNLMVKLGNFKPYKSVRSGGRWLKVVLDNEQARDWFDPDERDFRLSGLSPGWHAVRVYAVDANGECIKDPRAFDAINFYVRTDRNVPTPLDFGQPLVTYNLPSGTYTDREAIHVPLDFHVANTSLSSSGYRVRAKVSGLPPFDVTSWTPVRLEDLPAGTHTLLLTLIGPDGNAISHPWNPVEREFTVVREPIQ